MITISIATLEFIGSIILIGGTVFSVFLYFQKPQLNLEKRTSKLEDEVIDLNKQVISLKAEHLKSSEAMEKEIKELTVAVNDLSKIVVRLTTIIDERIPRAAPNLTPPGV